MHFIRFISPYCVTDWAVFNNAADYSCSAPKIDLLMYSTFAVQSGESARQQRVALVLPYVLLWSIRAVDHLSKNDSRDDPPARRRPGRTRAALRVRTPAHLPHASLGVVTTKQF